MPRVQGARETGGGNSVSTGLQYGMTELLSLRGAKIRGRNRADCPGCRGFRTISFTGEVFHCFKCSWKGNTLTLARDLGLLRRIPQAEYQRRQQDHEMAHEAADRLYKRVRARRFELLCELHALNDLETRAHSAGPEAESIWDALITVHVRGELILAELAILENCGAADLTKFLAADTETRRKAVTQVIEWGGVYNASGRFVEVAGE